MIQELNYCGKHVEWGHDDKAGEMVILPKIELFHGSALLVCSDVHPIEDKELFQKS